MAIDHHAQRAGEAHTLRDQHILSRAAGHLLYFIPPRRGNVSTLDTRSISTTGGCLWRNDRAAIPGMPTEPCAASTALGCGLWADPVASAMAGWGRSITRNRPIPRTRCPLSLMRSNLCRNGGSLGMLRPALRPRIGTTCSPRITSVTRKKATKLAVLGRIRGKNSQKHPKSAMETGSGEGPPAPAVATSPCPSAEIPPMGMRVGGGGIWEERYQKWVKREAPLVQMKSKSGPL